MFGYLVFEKKILFIMKRFIIGIALYLDMYEEHKEYIL